MIAERACLLRTACAGRPRRAPALRGRVVEVPLEEVRSCRVGPGRGLVAPDPGDVSPSGVLGRRPGGQSDDQDCTRPSGPGVRPRLCCTRAACCRRSVDGWLSCPRAAGPGDGSPRPRPGATPGEGAPA